MGDDAAHSDDTEAEDPVRVGVCATSVRGVPGTTGGNPGLRGEGLRVEPNSGSEDVDSVVVMAPRVRRAGLCFLGCVLKRRNASSGFFRRGPRAAQLGA